MIQIQESLKFEENLIQSKRKYAFKYTDNCIGLLNFIQTCLETWNFDFPYSHQARHGLVNNPLCRMQCLLIIAVSIGAICL